MYTANFTFIIRLWMKLTTQLLTNCHYKHTIIFYSTEAAALIMNSFMPHVIKI